MWWFRDRLSVLAGAWILVVLCLLHGLVLWRMARVVGYVSDRHVLLLVLCGVFTGTAAVAALGDWLAGRIEKGTSATVPVGPRTWPSITLLVALTLFGLPDDLRTLHANRAGHRAARLWLAEHAHPADKTFDPYCWAHCYAGRVFQEGIEPEAPAGYHVTYYAVLECSAQDHDQLP